MKKILLILITSFLSACASVRPLPSTVPAVNLKKYMGTWYEIASFPNLFQRGCQCTTAHYTLTDGRVNILNQCYKGASFQKSSASGIAWPTPGSNNSKLTVQFFWPFKGDYWILYLSPHYQQVIVGSPNRQYLWFLSRNKTMTKKRFIQLEKIAQHKGYDTRQLRITQQHCQIK